jgi:hypothetical protein
MTSKATGTETPGAAGNDQVGTPQRAPRADAGERRQAASLVEAHASNPRAESGAPRVVVEDEPGYGYGV